MPIYEYKCTKCGHQFEVTHSVNETVERCERCGAPVRKVFSPVGIIFKGSGFHINDYRKTPAPSDGDAKSTPPAAASSGTTGSTSSGSDSAKAPASTPAAPSAGAKSS
jgi:putative FmdB family regulatory protein